MVKSEGLLVPPLTFVVTVRKVFEPIEGEDEEEDEDEFEFFAAA